MMDGLAGFVRGMDPRLKVVCALLLGPCIWLLSPLAVLLSGAVLLPVAYGLSLSQPLGSRMIRSMVLFVLFWMVLKGVLDGFTGTPPMLLLTDLSVLGLRLATLLLLGLALALSTSARAMGLVVAWAIRPIMGAERAWQVALSLALMVHFLPLCLSVLNQVKETLSRRHPHCGLFQRMTIVPQAVLRNLGQKTWNQTLAVAGRGLESDEAWQPDFRWTVADTICASVLTIVGCIIFLI